MQIDQAIKRAIVRSDMEYLVGLGIDRWLHHDDAPCLPDPGDAELVRERPAQAGEVVPDG